MSDLIGQQWGNYRLTQLLGRGGFAEVYLGQHMRLNMFAAIKILHTHLPDDEVGTFQHEAQVVADLVHPNIVRVLDFDIKMGEPFLVLDYAPNGSLRQRHPRGSRVPLDQVVSYAKQVASALQYAHDRKLIHRDVKPENMLVRRNNEVLLTDFGIAAVAHSTSSMSTQSSVGTIPYMAPEQIQSYPRPASDQYALGMVVYQWLSGDLPFQGSTTEIIAKHLSVAPAPLRSSHPEIPAEVDHVVLTSLEKDPKARFGNIQAFANALEQAASAATLHPVQSSPMTPVSSSVPNVAATIFSNTPPIATPIITPPAPIALPSSNISVPSTIAANTSAAGSASTPTILGEQMPAISHGQPVYPQAAYAAPQQYQYPYPYPPSPPVRSVPGGARIAFLQGLIFGAIMVSTSLIMSYLIIPSMIRSQALRLVIVGDLNFAVLLLATCLCHFFAGLNTARRTGTLGTALISGVWIIACRSVLILISMIQIYSLYSQHSYGPAIIPVIVQNIIILLVLGAIGLGLSALGGRVGRNRTRAA